MKKRTIYITLFLIFIIGVISLIGTFAIDSSITEGNSSKADYLFNITLGDRTNREITIPSYDSKIVDIKISNPNEFNMSYLLYLEGINSNISIINISDTEASGVLNSKNTNLIKVFIQNNSSSDITTSIKDIVGFEKEILELPSNNTSINKGTYYKVIVKSNDNTYGKVKPNIKLSTSKGTVKYTLVPNTGYQYKSTTCNGAVSNNILTISNITNNTTCEVVFEPKQITVNFDLAGGKVTTTYIGPNEYTYTVPYTGNYKIELWGAQGGGTSIGNGAYTSGNIDLSEKEKLYFYTGGMGSSNSTQTNSGGYNGGGYSGNWEGCNSYGGGGSTDVRLSDGSWNDVSGLNTRIMVAAGGAGTGSCVTTTAGHAGGLIGGDGTTNHSDYNTAAYLPKGSTQTETGFAYETTVRQGGFGYAIQSNTLGWGGGGGGGYYGGSNGHGTTGSGGSSYISGHTGCVAIASSSSTTPKSGCTTGTSDNSCSIHYSGKKFTDTVMIDGSGYTWTNTKGSLQQMPKLNGSYDNGIGNSGNGVARITLMSNANYNVTYNTKYGTLPTPTRTGYTFEGWYTGENGTGTKVTNDTVLKNSNTHTLYAKWSKDVKVTFDNNIFSTSSNSMTIYGLSIKYDYNTSFLTMNGVPTGNSNLGFLNNLKFTLGEQYAMKLTYVSGSFTNSGTGGGGVIIDVKNSSNTIVSTRNNLDMGFTKNYSEGKLTINSSSVSDGTKLVYWLWFENPSQWTFSNYTFKIEVIKLESKTIKIGQKYGTMPTPTRSGYSFGGWYTEPDGGGTRITSDTVMSSTNDHTLYAKWNKNVNVTFNVAGGSYNVISTFTEVKENIYTVPYTGTYKLETWGAQGGTTIDGTGGGYGGYSTGTILLNSGDILYVNVGGQGSRTSSGTIEYIAGGYNGGGSTGGQACCNRSFGSGGGATHIATKSGLLSSLSSNLSDILIVSGGGGGAYYGENAGTTYGLRGGSGGGYIGNSGAESTETDNQWCAGLGGTQTAGGAISTNCSKSSDVSGGTITGSFGQGGENNWATTGGGGGFYGGSRSGHIAPGGGGSGYIGNSKLSNKYMYCYYCATSDATNTKTYATTTNVSGSPVSNYVKSGNGAARIILTSIIRTVQQSQKYGDMPTPIKAGYSFGGWYTGENGTGTRVTSDTIVSNASDHTLYAYWTAL